MAKGPVHATGQDKKLQEQLRHSGEIPQHIAIIMDGNGRWAKKRSLPRVAGHHEGVNSVRDIVEVCGQLGVKYLTLYAFSTENWKRPKDEVSMLMLLLLKALRDERDRLHNNNVKLKSIGDISALPHDVQDELLDAMELMKHNTGLTLVLALSYSGRWDITNAVKKIAHEIHLVNSKQIRSTTNLFPSISRQRTCPTLIFSSERAANFASATSFYGSWPTRKCISRTFVGRNSEDGRSTRRSPRSRAGNAGTEW